MFFYSSSPPCTKGLAISSLPSSGLISTSNVPLATIRPRDLVLSFPSSSVLRNVSAWGGNVAGVEEGRRTPQCFLHVVEDEVHELIVPLERADHYGDTSQPPSPFSNHRPPQLYTPAPTPTRSANVTRSKMYVPSLPPLNFTLISLSMYLVKSSIFSFFGLSFSASFPPRPPRCVDPPGRAPRSPRPRKLPRSDMCGLEVGVVGLE